MSRLVNLVILSLLWVVAPSDRIIALFVMPYLFHSLYLFHILYSVLVFLLCFFILFHSAGSLA